MSLCAGACTLGEAEGGALVCFQSQSPASSIAASSKEELKPLQDTDDTQFHTSTTD